MNSKKWGVFKDMVKEKFSHYYKKVPGEYIDVYRVLQLFEVYDPCIQHAVKKLLVAGSRGVKDINKDIQEAIDSLQRWKEMRIEEDNLSDKTGIKLSEKPQYKG
jgi:hypothetical protein